MQDIRYFYSNGTVQENPENLPQQVLAKLSGNEHAPIFRFAFEPAKNRIYVQDQSFRAMMGQGDKRAWELANQAMEFLESKFQARYLERAYGDLPGSSNKRMFSQYRKAWALVAKYMHAEFGVAPADVQVCEYCPLPGHEAERVTLSPKGGPVVGEQASGLVLYVNRYMGRPNGDADYSAVNRAAADFYLGNLATIMAIAAPDAGFSAKADRQADPLGYDLMFAVRDRSGATRVARARQGDRNKLLDEASLRESEGLEGYSGPIVLFHFDADSRQVIVQNGMPGPGDEVESMLRDVLKKVSAVSHVPERDISMTFPAGRGSPFSSKMSRYPVLWEIVRGHGPDAPVIELPVPIHDAIATAISSHEDEAEAAPAAQRIRAVNGLATGYPYVLVDNRTTRMGMKLRAILKAYVGLAGIELKEPSLDDLHDLRGREGMAKRVSFMLSMGMDKRDVVDFFAEPHDFPRRAELWAIATDVASKHSDEARMGRMAKVASMGKGLGINDWWYIGLQESLNAAEFQGDPAPKTAPFNLKQKRKKAKDEPVTYEGLLKAKHDPQAGYQKSLNQLLDESRS